MNYLIKKNFFSLYYCIIFTCYTINLFIRIPSVGIISSLLMGTFLLTLIMRKKFLKDKIDYLVLIFALVQTFSIFWFPSEKYPYVVFLKDYLYTILPLTFFYLKNYNQKNFFKYTNYAIFYSLIIGIILFYLTPNFYSQYLYDHGFTRSLLSSKDAMQSFYGVTSVGFFSVIGINYSLYNILFKKKESLKFSLSYFIVSVFSIILSGRRSAILAAFLTIIFYSIILLYNNKRSLIIKLAITIIVCILILGCLFPNQFSYLIERINSMQYAIGERSTNWSNNLYQLNNILIGNGLGTASHHVLNYNGIGVFDNQYLKIFVESGLIGITIFISIIIFSLKKAFTNKNYLSFCLLGIFVIQAIGSNIFSFLQLSPVIWFIIGQCHLKEVI